MYLIFRRFNFSELIKILSKGLKTKTKKYALFKMNLCTDKIGYFHDQ